MIVNLALIAVTVIVSWMAFKRRETGLALAMWPSIVHRKREYYRFITYGFVHADMQHLLFNMITLFFFGSMIEQVYAASIGPFGYVLFYVSALAISILPSYRQHRNDPGYLSIGASGAVSAVLFAFILYQPWSLIFVFFFPIPAIVYAVLYVAFTVYMNRRGTDNINHSAHLWGAAYGVLITVAVDPSSLSRFLLAVVHPPFLS